MGKGRGQGGANDLGLEEAARNVESRSKAAVLHVGVLTSFYALGGSDLDWTACAVSLRLAPVLSAGASLGPARSARRLERFSGFLERCGAFLGRGGVDQNDTVALPAAGKKRQHIVGVRRGRNVFVSTREGRPALGTAAPP